MRIHIVFFISWLLKEMFSKINKSNILIKIVLFQRTKPGHTFGILRYEEAREEEPTTQRRLCTGVDPCTILNCPFQWVALDHTNINILKITKLESVGGRINSQQWEGQQSTVRRLMINTVDCWSGGIDNQCREDQQSIALWVYHDASWVMLCPVPVKLRWIGLQNVWNLGYINVLKGRGQVSVHLFSPNLALLWISNVLMGRCR